MAPDHAPLDPGGSGAGGPCGARRVAQPAPGAARAASSSSAARSTTSARRRSRSTRRTSSTTASAAAGRATSSASYEGSRTLDFTGDGRAPRRPLRHRPRVRGGVAPRERASATGRAERPRGAASRTSRRFYERLPGSGAARRIERRARTCRSAAWRPRAHARFRLGLAPQSGFDRVVRRGTAEGLHGRGATARRPASRRQGRSGPIDRFRGRPRLPASATRAAASAASARASSPGAGDGPKYLNSPEYGGLPQGAGSSTGFTSRVRTIPIDSGAR